LPEILAKRKNATLSSLFPVGIVAKLLGEIAAIHYGDRRKPVKNG
jgi:hypothetical protein